MKHQKDNELLFWGSILLIVFTPLGMFMMYLNEIKGVSFHIFEIVVVVTGIVGGILNVFFGSGVLKID